MCMSVCVCVCVCERVCVCVCVCRAVLSVSNHLLVLARILNDTFI